MLPCASAKAVAKEDLVGVSSGLLVKASDQAWDTDLATTRAAFVALFLGVAAQTKPADGSAHGNAGDNLLKVRVNTGGVHTFACAAGTYTVGQWVGPAKQTGNALENQILEGVASAAQAIGKVAGREGVNPSKIEVEILSTMIPAAK
jgi:hypothetical protein